jgi:hypothetical protein
MDTHRRPPPPSAANTVNTTSVNVPCSTGIVSSTLVNSTTGEQATIYSGVDLARLASVAGESVVEEHRQDRSSPYSHMIGTTGHLLMSSSPPVTVTTSITTHNGHLSSPEPEGLSNNHVSRIDKWKAKHQAMLKMVAEEKGRNSPSPPLESTNKLVITLEKGDEDSYPAHARPSLTTALVV